MAKNNFRYKKGNEEISGDSDAVLKFKQQQYKFRIAWAIILTMLSIIGTAVKIYLFSAK